MEGEVIRDSLLQVAGKLNLEMGGPGFNFFKSRGGLNGFPPVDEFKSDGWKRMIYSHKVRMETVPVFGAFDCPDGGQSAPVRSQSTTAMQALNLFNSPFVMEQAESLAKQIQRAEKTIEVQARMGFVAVLGREPNWRELLESMKAVSETDLTVLCRALFNSNEFLFIP